MNRKHFTYFVCLTLVLAFGVAGCATSKVRAKYRKLYNAEDESYRTRITELDSLKNRIVPVNKANTHLQYNELNNRNKTPNQIQASQFIAQLKEKYPAANIKTVFAYCHKVCKTARQLEMLVAVSHNEVLGQKIAKAKQEEEQQYKEKRAKLDANYKVEYARAVQEQRQAWQAFAAGMSAAGQSMQQSAQKQQYGYQQNYSTPRSTYTPVSRIPRRTYSTYGTNTYGTSAYKGQYLGKLSGNPYAPDSTSNQFGSYGSQFSSTSINNQFGAGNPFGPAPKLYDSQGNYRGKLSTNQFDPDSTSNPFGRYGSQFSPDSINNQFGAGSQFKHDSPNNPFGTGWTIIGQ